MECTKPEAINGLGCWMNNKELKRLLKLLESSVVGAGARQVGSLWKALF